MMRGTLSRHKTRKVVAVTVVAIALVALLAAPALAAPAATTWEVSPSSATVTYGRGVILNGTLMSDLAAVGGKWVDFQQSTTEAGSFQVLYKVTTAGDAYYTGMYSVAVLPMQTTYYRFSWAGDADYAASDSDVIPVWVKPALGKPSCPSKAKPGKPFTVKGSVKPGAPTGPKVKLKAYRLRSGSWVYYRTYNTKISGTRYSASVKPNHTGKFKFRAVTSASAAFAAAQSSYSSVITIKK